MSQQLVKKGSDGRYSNVMPKSWIEAIKDKNTGQTLVEILQGFNMYFLSYNGNTSATRCLVPKILRKKGLWITYVKYDGNVYTEWYAANKINDKSWGDSSNWRIGNNILVGDITISANGNWVINGIETEFKAVGEKGNTPLIRVANNRLQVSYDLGDTYRDVTNNPVYTKFRWSYTTGDTQNNIVGRLQSSVDEGKTWTNISNDFTNNLHIKKYIGANESLPTSGIAEGTIYAKGPTYAVEDTSNSNPIYRLWVYAWKDNTLAWQDNGEFTSITAGIVQETGSNENAVMSQKATTEAINMILYDVSAHNDGAVFESLQDLLSRSNLDTLIPISVRHGGMTIRFIHSSDNKYVQYRYVGSLIKDTYFTCPSNWLSDNSTLRINPNINGYINNSTGAVVTTDSWRCSDLITVYEGLKLEVYSRIASTNVILGYYDKNGTFLSELSPKDTQVDPNAYNKRVITIPAGVAYARFNSAYDPNISSYALILDQDYQYISKTIQYVIQDVNNQMSEIDSGIEEINNKISVHETVADWGAVLADCDGNTVDNDIVFYNKEAPGSKPTHITKIKYKVGGAGGTTKLYKVTESGATASAVEIATIVNDVSVNPHIYECDINLAENEYIGISGKIYYKNYVTGYKYKNFPVSGGNTTEQRGMIGFRLVDEVELTLEDAINKIETLESKVRNPNEIIVDINGNGDYTNPFDAIVATLGQDTALNPITIKILPGTYIMPTLPHEHDNTYCNRRYLSLVGTDKLNCILVNNKGYYNGANSAVDNYGDNAPLKINGNVYIANLTIISTDLESESDANIYHRSYCIHTDAAANENSVLEVHNCILRNNHAPCIGYGLTKNGTLKITDSELYSTLYNTEDWSNKGGAVIWGHDRNSSPSTTVIEEHLVVKDCIIKGSNCHAVVSNNNNNGLMDCVFINNAVDVPNGKGINLGASTTIDKLSYGNALAAMDYSS